MSFQLAIQQVKQILRVSALLKWDCRTISAAPRRSANTSRNYMEEVDEEQYRQLHKKDQPRYDELYYKPTTNEREFTQTWVEFDEIEEVTAPKAHAPEPIDSGKLQRRRPISYMNADTAMGGNWRNLCQVTTTGDHSYSRPALQMSQLKPRGYHADGSAKMETKMIAPAPSYAESREPKLGTTKVENGCLKVYHFSPYGNDRKRLA